MGAQQGGGLGEVLAIGPAHLARPPHRLALYVYEYLLHVGAQKSAQTFLSEVSYTPAWPFPLPHPGSSALFPLGHQLGWLLRWPREPRARMGSGT